MSDRVDDAVPEQHDLQRDLRHFCPFPLAAAFLAFSAFATPRKAAAARLSTK